ncbi:hypothetical protein V2I01_25945 [Micromonospora sp. BRA006-A]|nr:hypothetical protein [Micromonospora sp. BRA006-A]
MATGAPVPARADRVVPYEIADRIGDVLRAVPATVGTSGARASTPPAVRNWCRRVRRSRRRCWGWPRASASTTSPSGPDPGPAW